MFDLRSSRHVGNSLCAMLGILTIVGGFLGTSGTLWAQADPGREEGTDRSDSAAADPGQWANAHLSELIDLYRELHRHPELSFHERWTSQRMAEELRAVGATVTRGVGGHGVVGMLENGEGPTVMLRTDLDGLPVTEQTQLVYASQRRVKNEAGVEVGVMHACGHDVHMTCWVGTARFLAAHRDRWQGTLMMVGQPAEERGAGAAAMLEDGLFERFAKPDYALAMHCDASLAAGKVGYRGGYALANVDSVDITVKGRGGHGAYPHTTVDPIVQAAQLIMALQTIVSREVIPTEPAVITVGSIHGGTKHNVIGNECHLQLTVRSYADDVRQQLLEAIEHKAVSMAEVAGAPAPEVTISEGTPSLRNAERLAERLGPVFREALGEENVGEAELSMGGEDFSRYGRAGVPIMMFRLGTVEARRLARFKQLGQQPPSLHSPLFYPDAEPTIRTGVTALASAALHLLQ